MCSYCLGIDLLAAISIVWSLNKYDILVSFEYWKQSNYFNWYAFNAEGLASANCQCFSKNEKNHSLFRYKEAYKNYFICVVQEGKKRRSQQQLKQMASVCRRPFERIPFKYAQCKQTNAFKFRIVLFHFISTISI